MQQQDNTSNRPEIRTALEVIPRNSGGLPLEAPSPESARYPAYGPPNRIDEGVRLRDVWLAISKRRWLIVFIVLLITATTAVMLARKPDIYLAESEVQVDTESPASGITSGKGNAIIVDTFTDPSYFNTELQIISSRAATQGCEDAGPREQSGFSASSSRYSVAAADAHLWSGWKPATRYRSER